MSARLSPPGQKHSGGLDELISDPMTGVITAAEGGGGRGYYGSRGREGGRGHYSSRGGGGSRGHYSSRGGGGIWGHYGSRGVGV